MSKVEVTRDPWTADWIIRYGMGEARITFKDALATIWKHCIIEALEEAGVPEEHSIDAAIQLITEMDLSSHYRTSYLTEKALTEHTKKTLGRFGQALAVLAWAVQFDPVTREARDPLRRAWR